MTVANAYYFARLGCLLALWLLVGCAQDEAPPTPDAATPMPPPIGEIGAPPHVPAASRQLVIWLPPFTGVTLGEQAGAVLEDAFFQFEQAHPGVNVDVHIKAEFGPAGLPTFLRSAQQVAPSILPDLVLMRTSQLWQMVDLGLVPPLNVDEFPLLDDFYPFSLAAVTYRDQRHGVPFAADILVMVYDPAQIEIAPRTWADVLALDNPLLLAGGSAEGALNLPALVQYVGAGGELREDGAFTSPAALEAWFDFLGMAQAQNLIDPHSTELATSDAVWRAYVAQPHGLAFVLAGDALGQQFLFAGLALAPVPTQTGRSVTIAPTWALAVLTTDPEQRQLAAALVESLLAPEVQGLWSRLAHRPPSRRAALAAWTSGEGDMPLLGALLEAAVALPNGRPFAEFARRIQLAQFGVLRGELSSLEAVQLVRAGE